MVNFSPNYRFEYGNNQVPAGQTDFDCDPVDLAASGSHTVAAFCQYRTRVANAELTVKLQTSDSNTTGWADVPGSTVTHSGAADAKGFVVCETNTDASKLKRYVRAQVERGTANVTIDGVFYVLCSGQRRTGVIVKGAVRAGVIGQERSSFTAP